MKKRFRGAISWILILAMLINIGSIPSMAANSVEFEMGDYYDIENHWAKSQIDRLVSEQVVTGAIEEGHIVIEPDKPITRAEYVVLTLKGMFSETELRKQIGAAELSGKFNDIQGHWARAYIELAHKLGIISGYSDSSFKPDNEITRSEAVAVMVLSSKSLQEENRGQISFSDLPVDHWAFPYITIAKNSGLISGYPNHTFRPNAQITRAESMVVTD